MFDEPSSYLDVKQRLAAARMIRSLSKHNNYIIGMLPLVTCNLSERDEHSRLTSFQSLSTILAS